MVKLSYSEKKVLTAFARTGYGLLPLPHEKNDYDDCRRYRLDCGAAFRTTQYAHGRHGKHGLGHFFGNRNRQYGRGIRHDD